MLIDLAAYVVATLAALLVIERAVWRASRSFFRILRILGLVPRVRRFPAPPTP